MYFVFRRLWGNVGDSSELRVFVEVSFSLLIINTGLISVKSDRLVT